MKNQQITAWHWLALAALALVLAACSKAGSTAGSTEKTLYVGPVLVDCVGVGPQKCMLVKERPEDEYTAFYDQIEGFDYEKGYEYEIRVRVDEVPNPPADASSLRYTLIEVVSKVPATYEQALYVGPVLVDCVGVGPQKCMLVKERPEDEYTAFYDQIEGFDYEEGYEYQIRVSVERVPDPPADASSLRYTLVEVVDAKPSLEGRPWTLVSYIDGGGNGADVLPETEVTAEFRAGQVNGKAGCNNYFGSYKLSGTELTIGPVGITEMWCAAPEGIMEQEQAYVAALQSVVSYQVTEERLQLADAGGNMVLTFRALEPASLAGSWVVSHYNNGTGGFSSVLLDTEITAIFDEDGSLTGSAGCNNYTTSYEADGSNIAVGPAGVTRKMCNEPPGIMEQEQAYLAALGNVATYHIEGDRMEMRDLSGTRMLALIAEGSAQ